MLQSLSDEHRARYAEFKEFVATNVTPFADEWDRSERVTDSVIAALAAAGHLSSSLSVEHGGEGRDVVTFGLLNEAVGRGSSSLTDLLTVQAMVSMTLAKWGTAEQKSEWLPPLAAGELVGAYALTEPGAGSDLQSLTTELTRAPSGDGWVLNGRKRWISYAQQAGLFLVFGKLEGLAVACLVPRNAPGLVVEPIRGMMGFRAAGLGEVRFDNVALPKNALVGKPGFALSHVAPVGLHYGRISTACSALGLARACFEECVTHAAARKIGERSVGELGMIRSIVARMGTELEAGGLLCMSACRADDERQPESFQKALMAKYFTSTAAVRAAADAIQIKGAAGCHESSPTARYHRDAKIMEIIEGTTQIHEDLLGKLFVDRWGRARR